MKAILVLIVVGVFAQLAISQQGKLIFNRTDSNFTYISNTLIYDGRYVLAASQILNPKLHPQAKVELTDIQSGYTTTVWRAQIVDQLIMQLSDSPYFAVSHRQTPGTNSYSLEVHASYSQQHSTLLWSIFTTEIVAIRIAKTRPVLTTATINGDGSSELLWYNAQDGTKIGSWKSPVSFRLSTGWQLSDDGTIFAFSQGSNIFALDISYNVAKVLLHSFMPPFVADSLALSPSGRTIFVSCLREFKIFTYSANSRQFYFSMNSSLARYGNIILYAKIAALTDSYVVIGCQELENEYIGIQVFSVAYPEPVWQYLIRNTILNINYTRQIKISDDEQLVSFAFAGDLVRMNPQLMVFSMNGQLVWKYTPGGPMLSVDIVSPHKGLYLVSTCGHFSWYLPDYYEGALLVGQIQYFEKET